MGYVEGFEIKRVIEVQIGVYIGITETKNIEVAQG